MYHSVLVGLLAGTGAVIFHLVLNFLRHLFDPGRISSSGVIPAWSVIFIPVLGGIVIAAMARRYPGLARERGVVSAIRSLLQNNGIIRWKVTLFHFIAPIIAIGTGHPLGPEGPAAKLGSGIGSFMSQKLDLHRSGTRMYTSAGAGAAISAVFNAPITGVFFGIEVMLLNDIKNEALSALVVSSVVADLLSRAVLGNHHIISIPGGGLGSLHAYHFFLLLGLTCGVLSVAYFRLKKLSRYFLSDVLSMTNEYQRLIPVCLLFGVVAFFWYPLFGLGYQAITDTLNGAFSLHDLGILLFFKIFFLGLFLVAGSFGGSFAPSLGMGAMAGYLLAGFLNSVGGMNLDPVTFALVGMGGMLAGINSVPLAAIMLVFEITNDYRIVLPLMLVSIITYVMTVFCNKGTVYSRELFHLGIDLSKRREADLLGKIKVKDVMTQDFTSVSYRTPFESVADLLVKSNHGDIVVVGEDEKLKGMISLREVRQAIVSMELVNLLIADDITSEVPLLTGEDTISDALKKLEQYDLENVPVVFSPEDTRVSGFLSQGAILQSYTSLLREWEADQLFMSNYLRRG